MALTAGVTGMPALRFFMACSAGNLVYAIVLAGNGAALVPNALAGPGLVVPMLLPVAAWLVWRQWAKRQETVGERK